MKSTIAFKVPKIYTYIYTYTYIAKFNTTEYNGLNNRQCVPRRMNVRFLFLYDNKNIGINSLVLSIMSCWNLFLKLIINIEYENAVAALETVSHKRRVVFSCMSDILSSFGTAFFGLIAWKVPYWRSMMRAIYAPLLVVVFYIFLVDEGVRWLLAHDKRDEAVRVLNKVAKINKITLSHKAKEMLTKISEEKNQVTPVINYKGISCALKATILNQ